LQLKLEKVLKRVTGMVKDTAQQLSKKQWSKKELFSLAMTEKAALMSGRERVSRGQFFPYFRLQESQGVSRSDGGRLKTNERR